MIADGSPPDGSAPGRRPNFDTVLLVLGALAILVLLAVAAWTSW